MWFDARAKLVELGGKPTATSAPSQPLRPVLQESQVSQHPDAPKPVSRVAGVAGVATRRVQNPDPAPPPEQAQIGPSFGTACDLRQYPRTWSGRVVSLAAWRELTDWERHGPRGRRWNGLTGQWE